MKEVEIKVKVADLPELQRKLETGGFVFGQPTVQEDVIYIPEHEHFVPVKPGVNVLRIRKQGEKTLFTLKQSDPHNHLSKLEYELEISSGNEMRNIIGLLGFKEVTRVKKTRTKSKKEELEVCLDVVEGLGSFVEVEKMTDADPSVAQQEMVELLAKYGVDASDRVHLGYDILMVQKNSE